MSDDNNRKGKLDRMCQHCGQTAERVDPLEDFAIRWGTSGADRKFVADSATGKLIRLGHHCGCYDLFRYGNHTGQVLAAESTDIQVGYLAIWTDEHNCYAGAGYRNQQAHEIAPGNIPVTMAVMLAIGPHIVDDILIHPKGLENLIQLPITPEDIRNPIERARSEQMVAVNRQMVMDYLLREDNEKLRGTLTQTVELAEVLQAHHVLELGRTVADPDPGDSLRKFLKQ